MNRVNEIVICKDTYRSEEEFKNAIKDAVMVLLNNNYIMTVRYDEPGIGIVCISYDNADQSYGGSYPYWLTVQQAEIIELGDND